MKEEDKTQENLEIGLRNKHFKKVEKQKLLDEYLIIHIRKHQIERLAGFYDKKDNIFEKKET